MLPEVKKEKETTSIGIAVSFDGSSASELKIVMVRSDGSEAMLITLVGITKDGMTYIRDHGWNEMFSTSGAKEIVELKGGGND